MAAPEGRSGFWSPSVPRNNQEADAVAGLAAAHHIAQEWCNEALFAEWRQAATPPCFFKVTFDGSFQRGDCAWGSVIFAATNLTEQGQPEWRKICAAGALLTATELEGHLKSAMIAETYALHHALSLVERLICSVSRGIISR